MLCLSGLEQCSRWVPLIQAVGHVLSVADVRFVGSGEGLPSPLHWEVSRPTLDHHLSWGESGQLSQRSPSVADQRVKV